MTTLFKKKYILMLRNIKIHTLEFDATLSSGGLHSQVRVNHKESMVGVYNVCFSIDIYIILR
jgi:hypothetical protein